MVSTMAVGVLFYWVHCFCTVNILLYEFKFNASYPGGEDDIQNVSRLRP